MSVHCFWAGGLFIGYAVVSYRLFKAGLQLSSKKARAVCIKSLVVGFVCASIAASILWFQLKVSEIVLINYSVVFSFCLIAESNAADACLQAKVHDLLNRNDGKGATTTRGKK